MAFFRAIYTFLVIFHRLVLFFFFKQKTAYEMRISDWSSDVCSSDLGGGDRTRPVDARAVAPHPDARTCRGASVVQPASSWAEPDGDRAGVARAIVAAARRIAHGDRPGQQLRRFAPPPSQRPAAVRTAAAVSAPARTQAPASRAAYRHRHLVAWRSAAWRRHRRRDRARPLDRPDALCRAARPGQGVPDRVADADRWRPHDNRARTDAADDRIAAQGNALNLFRMDEGDRHALSRTRRNRLFRFGSPDAGSGSAGHSSEQRLGGTELVSKCRSRV